MNPKHISLHLFKYMVPGVTTFGLDLALLWLLTETFSVHYLTAAALAFLISTSVNFFGVRYWAFKKLERKIHESYGYFTSFAIVGVVLTTAFMWLFVELFVFGTFVARVLTATIVGLWNFLMNYFINFKMHKNQDDGSVKVTTDI